MSAMVFLTAKSQQSPGDLGRGAWSAGKCFLPFGLLSRVLIVLSLSSPLATEGLECEDWKPGSECGKDHVHT